MKSKYLFLLAIGVLLIVGGYFWYFKNFVELSTEYYTISVAVPSEYDNEFTYRTGVKIEPEISISRKHTYTSDEEAVKAEQSYADDYRRFFKYDLEEELAKGTSKLDVKVRLFQRESEASYYLIKLSHTKSADLTGLWKIIKAKGVYDSEWETFCNSNNITYTFLPLENIKSY